MPLVVDDEQEVRELYADLLEMDGHTVETAANGVEAEAAVCHHAPDVVVVETYIFNSSKVLRRF